MKKVLYSSLYLVTLFSAGFGFHQAFASRGPSVEPITEVSVEDNRPTKLQSFDFADKTHVVAETKRIPANIVTKTPTENKKPYSIIGPLIFLLALPVALWIVVAKKMQSTPPAQKPEEFYPKHHQLNNYRSKYESEDEEDQDYPKAS